MLNNVCGNLAAVICLQLMQHFVGERNRNDFEISVVELYDKEERWKLGARL